MSNIRDELVHIQNQYGKLPGDRLTKLLRYPGIYGLDALSANVRLQVNILRARPEIQLSEMEVAFLESFGQSYNY